MDKLISVVIPTYNRKTLTDNAVDSVITAKPDLVEIVVVDDCSTTPYVYNNRVNTNGVLVRVLRLEKNVGASVARKIGVEAAVSNTIAFLDSDDYYGKDWMDSIITLVQQKNDIKDASYVIVGEAIGAKISGRLVWWTLIKTPAILQTAFSRFIVTMFNPFYTPSLMITKSLCHFLEDLRYCEDYFTNAYAIFRADRVLVIPKIACHLGRKAGSIGGASGFRKKMFRGEMRVRFALLRMSAVPIYYKILIPIGIVYQLLRSLIKLSIRGNI